MRCAQFILNFMQTPATQKAFCLFWCVRCRHLFVERIENSNPRIIAAFFFTYYAGRVYPLIKLSCARAARGTLFSFAYRHVAYARG